MFGAEGVWQELLRLGSGYIATEVECEIPLERRYRVRDFWAGHSKFELFRQQYAREYEHFDRLISANGLIERQQFLGGYYEDSDGDDLVPS